MLEYVFFFFQAEDGIRDLVRSRGLGDVYKRQEIVDERGFVLDVGFVHAELLGHDLHDALFDVFHLSLIHI